MSKYNVGDRVVIRDWDDMAEEYGLTPYSENINCNRYFTTGMRYLCGREFTIKALDERDGSVEFEENNDWNYHIDMIRPVFHYKDLNIPSSDLIDNLIFT